jgi:2-polyprenyl-3-methyl-5-hydroxy-6-metoxy-1,4-benzoquinol methylase
LNCAGCGLVLNPEIFQSGASDKLNEEAFGDANAKSPSIWTRWFDARKNKRYLNYLKSVGVKVGRLLEVGVGMGGFLTAARNAGFIVYGCDLSALICQRVEHMTGIQMFCQRLESLSAGEFDVMMMNHVVEHVQDPLGFLRSAYERLRPGGVLHVAVPNLSCWEGKLPGWNYYVKYHLSYFTVETLGMALRKAGFVLVASSTHESFSTWFLTILRTVVGIRPYSEPRIAASLGRVPNWWWLVEHPYRLAMIIMGVSLWPLRWIQGKLGHGDELICIVKKKS